VALSSYNYLAKNVATMHISGNSSVGRAQPCQGLRFSPYPSL